MPKDFLFINVFRALAAFWVLLGHCMIWGGWSGIPLPAPKIAVDVFMIISGYLMAANATARLKFEPMNSGRSWLRFWVRRFFRLAPGYYLSLLLVILLGRYFLEGYHLLWHHTFHAEGNLSVYDPLRIQYTGGNILMHVSFLFGLHPEYSFSTFLPDWSLSLEMQFYVVFPALFCLLQRFGFLSVSLVLGIASLLLGGWIAASVNFFEPSLLCFKLQYFLAGILLFESLQETPRKAIEKLGMMLLAFALVSTEKTRYGNEMWTLPALLGIMFTMGWFERRNPDSIWYQRFVDNRLVRFASDTSYGVYLFHGFFISSFGWLIKKNYFLRHADFGTRALVMLPMVLLGAYLVGALVHRWVERPFIGLGKSLLRKKLPPSPLPTPSTEGSGQAV